MTLLRSARAAAALLALLPLAAAPAIAADTPPAAPPAQPPAYGPPVTLDAAHKVIAAAEAESRKMGVTEVVTVVDSGGNVVAMERMDSTQLGSIQIAEGKARSAVQFRRPTKAFQDALGQGGDGQRVLTMGIVAIEGGDLLIAGGKIIGAVGTSGGTPAQDEQVALAGVAALPK